MKRAISLILSLLCLQTAIASPADTANIRIKVTGAVSDNTYFLCLPNVGCLSILAAQKGKIYSIPGQLRVDGIFVTDVDHNFRVTPEGLPSSCDVTVQPSQTVTISGHINPGPNQSATISGLRCTVSA
jgi:hypothetical protein